MKISNKAIVVGVGGECPKCNDAMERRKHPTHWKSRKIYYYTEWDYCNKCQHVQHYDKYKSPLWLEKENKENFLKNI